MLRDPCPRSVPPPLNISLHLSKLEEVAKGSDRAGSMVSPLPTLHVSSSWDFLREQWTFWTSPQGPSPSLSLSSAIALLLPSLPNEEHLGIPRLRLTDPTPAYRSHTGLSGGLWAPELPFCSFFAQRLELLIGTVIPKGAHAFKNKYHGRTIC